MTNQHIPVMLHEVMEALSPKDGEVYVDATFGAGGYSRAIIEAANCNLYAIDRDPIAWQIGNNLKKKIILQCYQVVSHSFMNCFKIRMLVK